MLVLTPPAHRLVCPSAVHHDLSQVFQRLCRTFPPSLVGENVGEDLLLLWGNRLALRPLWPAILPASRGAAGATFARRFAEHRP